MGSAKGLALKRDSDRPAVSLSLLFGCLQPRAKRSSNLSPRSACLAPCTSGLKPLTNRHVLQPFLAFLAFLACLAGQRPTGNCLFAHSKARRGYRII